MLAFNVSPSFSPPPPSGGLLFDEEVGESYWHEEEAKGEVKGGEAEEVSGVSNQGG